MPFVRELDLSASQMVFQVAGGTEDQFQVMRYRGAEGLCQLYRFEIEVATTDNAVDFDALVGHVSVLSINTPGGERYFHGVISRLEHIGETEGQTYYRIELVPKL